VESSPAPALGQRLRQPGLQPQPPLAPRHAPVVALVIVSQEMKQTVKCEEAKLIGFSVARTPGLPASHPTGDRDVP
jgi:hypothetical protein